MEIAPGSIHHKRKHLHAIYRPCIKLYHHKYVLRLQAQRLKEALLFYLHCHAWVVRNHFFWFVDCPWRAPASGQAGQCDNVKVPPKNANMWACSLVCHFGMLFLAFLTRKV